MPPSFSFFGSAPHLRFDNETVDDLITSLWRWGSAADYPRPEDPPPEDRRRRRWATFTDLRSRTLDRDLDDPPVPGYRDWPAGITVDYAAERPIKAAGSVTAKRRR